MTEQEENKPEPAQPEDARESSPLRGQSDPGPTRSTWEIGADRPRTIDLAAFAETTQAHQARKEAAALEAERAALEARRAALEAERVALEAAARNGTSYGAFDTGSGPFGTALQTEVQSHREKIAALVTIIKEMDQIIEHQFEQLESREKERDLIRNTLQTFERTFKAGSDVLDTILSDIDQQPTPKRPTAKTIIANYYRVRGRSPRKLPFAKYLRQIGESHREGYIRKVKSGYDTLHKRGKSG